MEDLILANLVITSKCNRACPYCFASKYMDDNDIFLSWDNLIYVIDFLEFNGVHSISIMGGEPTLHPHFLDYVEYTLKRLNHTTIFTNGIIDKAKVDSLNNILNYHDYKNKVTIVCNVNEHKITPKNEWEKIEYFLKTLGNAVLLGFNIFEIDFDLNFLFFYIAKYNLNHSIRIGLAHPIYGKKNIYVYPDKFDKVVERVTSFIPKFMAMKTRPAFDCGFPMCSFSDENLGKFMKARASFHWKCAPVVDIGPDLSIWPCFPLSVYKKQSLLNFNSMEEINDFFINLIKNECRGNTGVYDECDSCELYENGLCTGGCIANFIPSDNIQRI